MNGEIRDREKTMIGLKKCDSTSLKLNQYLINLKLEVDRLKRKRKNLQFIIIRTVIVYGHYNNK